MAHIVSLPLSGVRILDLTRALSGPLCTALLADLGAEVIKVEGAPGGDSTRHWPPFDADRSLYFLSANRNKRSIALDLRTSEAREILRRLVDQADVLIENFRPGILTKLGLDPEALAATHPDLIVTSITGFGPIGPLSDAAGLDQVAQGMSGLMSVTGAGEHTPMRVGVPIADIATGLFTAVGVAAALVGRTRGNSSRRVATSLIESTTSLLTFQAQRYLTAGQVPEPQGNDHPLIAAYGAFSASDKPFNVAVGTDAHWSALCRVVGRPALATREEFARPPDRSANRAALAAELNALFSQRTAAEWVSELRAAGVPCGPIYTMDSVFADEQVRALQLVEEVTGADGTDRLMRGPIWIDGEPTHVRLSPPRLGEHSSEILGELGYDIDTIADLVEQRVVVQDAVRPERAR